MDATHCEIGNLELYLDRHTGVFLAFFALNARETELGAHHVLFTARELLDAPDHSVLIWYVFDGSNIGPEDRGVNIRGH